MKENEKLQAWSRILDCLDKEYKTLLTDVRVFLQENPLSENETQPQWIARSGYLTLINWEEKAQQSIYEGWKDVEEIKEDLAKEFERLPHLQKEKAMPFEESNLMSYALSSYRSSLFGFFKGIIACAQAIRFPDSENEKKWLNKLINLVHENSRFKIQFVEIGQKIMPGEVHFLDTPNPETDWRIKECYDQVKIVSAGKVWHFPTVSV